MNSNHIPIRAATPLPLTAAVNALAGCAPLDEQAGPVCRTAEGE